jgi:hypothetical protein
LWVEVSLELIYCKIVVLLVTNVWIISILLLEANKYKPSGRAANGEILENTTIIMEGNDLNVRVLLEVATTMSKLVI